MGFKCSVFGHDYADYDVERDRTDHGREVVATVRTTEICRKCGDARIVSENTEITAASAATPTTAADGASSGDAGDAGDRSEPGRERTDRDTESNGDRSPRSGTDGFEFEGKARSDRDAVVSENGSVGPTTAHATSRSLAESELRCRACEFSEALLGSPLRAGDSCPQCSQGYLARRTRKE